MSREIPYDVGDVELEECKVIVHRLRASGRYSNVTIRRRASEWRQGVEVKFGRIYVRYAER